MNRLEIYALFFLLSIGCVSEPAPASQVNTRAQTVLMRFSAPENYVRVPQTTNSFGNYLRQLPLKPHNAAVLLYDGSLKGNQNAHVAVLDVDCGSRNLQQCADAVMRLRAEYLFHNGLTDQLSFNFTNGFVCNFDKWKQGYKVTVNGNKCEWEYSGDNNDSYTSFRKYMDVVFTYAGTLSLARQLHAKSLNDVMPGDVLIKGGSPGHAVIVLDVCKHKSNGKKLMILAQSYMPAQDIHILRNPMDNQLSPWYVVDAGKAEIITPEWTFYSSQLMAF